ELVGKEENLAVGGDRGDDLGGIGRGAAHVGFGLHLGARVHVRDHRSARMLGLPRPDLIRRDAVRERTAGGGVRRQHGTVGGKAFFAVPAMKYTPASTITRAELAAARRASASESPTWSATAWISGRW